MAYQGINYEDRIHISIRLKKQWKYQSIADELQWNKGTIRERDFPGQEHVLECWFIWLQQPHQMAKSRRN